MLGGQRSLCGSAPLWCPQRKGGFKSNSTSIVGARGPFKPIDHAKTFAYGGLLKRGLPCFVWRRSSLLERPVQYTSAATSAAAASAGAKLPASQHPPAASEPSDYSGSSSSSGSCERATKGPLNVVDMAEEGDILRGLKVGPLTWAGEGSIRLLLQRVGLYETFAFRRLLPGETVTLRVEGLRPRKGKCKAALLGTELPAPGHRLPPCPHFFQGCSGCQLLHLEPAHQLKAKQQLLHRQLQELLDEQQQHQQPQVQQPQEDAKPLDVGFSEALLCEAGFAARGDFLVEAEGSMVRVGLPSTTGTGGLIGVQRCLRLAAPLQEAYTQLSEVLLPLLEGRRLRPLHPRSNAGCLSGVTLRLAESMSKSESQVLIRLRGHLEEAARPALLQLAETLASRLPSLKAVTFQDLRRSRQPDELLLGSDSIMMTVLGRSFRITGKRPLRSLSVAGLQGMMHRVAAAVGQAVRTDTRGKRLWTALECGGFFALLLADQFLQVTAFAAGFVDAEETRKNFLLNDLRNAEVVECADSRNVAVALAAISGLWRSQNDCSSSKQPEQPSSSVDKELCTRAADVSQGLPEKARAPTAGTPAAARAETQVGGTFKEDCVSESLLRACSSSRERPSRFAPGGHGGARNTEAPDVLLLTPSRGGLPKACWSPVARVVFVAHDQQAFLRDAKALVRQGYALSFFRAFDIAPHTTEIVAVAAFCRRELVPAAADKV
ncbi:hypothetical protein Esti_005299 [Eimeria stiedai]